jgi:hypothetical protein
VIKKRKYRIVPFQRSVHPAFERITILFLSFIFFYLNINIVAAQTIPLGKWQSHISYLSAQHLTQVNGKIFCSTYNGLFSIDTTSKEIRTFSKADGLSETGISSMNYDVQDHTLIIAYRNGNLDLVLLDDADAPDQTTSWPVFKNVPDLPDDKQINKIILRDGLTYLATNFGIVVLDTRLLQVKETYRYIGNNGNETTVKDLAFTPDSIFALTAQGILASSMQPTVNRQYFANWKAVPTPGTAVALSSQSGILYAGLSGSGIFRRMQGTWVSIMQSPSKRFSFSSGEANLIASLDNSLVTLSASGLTTTIQDPLLVFPKESIRTSEHTIWTADGKTGLVGNIEGNFRTYSPAEGDTTINPRTDSSIVDRNGLTWSRLPSYLGGGISVKNKETNQERFLTTSPGNGGLPSSSINSITVDEDNYIWFASDRGIGYLIPDEVISGMPVNAVLPVYGQKRLFSGEKCTSVTTQPGNQKWIGTRNGLYLFSSDGTELITHFTTSGSPLPDNYISALKFEPSAGILFIDTPNGMVSYRSSSSEAKEDLSSVTIFPNPVHPGYGGLVGIKGLMDRSIVKITQLSGRLVYETRSQGGTASWNLNDYSGNRAKGGIYMILIVSEKGEKKLAGKLAIID